MKKYKKLNSLLILVSGLLFSIPTFSNTGNMEKKDCIRKDQLMTIQNEIYKAHSNSIAIGNKLNGKANEIDLRELYNRNRKVELGSTSAYRQLRHLTGQ